MIVKVFIRYVIVPIINIVIQNVYICCAVINILYQQQTYKHISNVTQHIYLKRFIGIKVHYVDKHEPYVLTSKYAYSFTVYSMEENYTYMSNDDLYKYFNVPWLYQTTFSDKFH